MRGDRQDRLRLNMFRLNGTGRRMFVVSILQKMAAKTPERITCIEHQILISDRDPWWV